MLKEKKGDKYVFEIDKKEKDEVAYSLEELNNRKKLLESRILKQTSELELINSFLKEING